MGKSKLLKLFFIFYLLLLIGCTDIDVHTIRYFDENDIKGEVIKVQIMTCDGLSRGIVEKTIDETLIDDFLYDLSLIEWKHYGLPNDVSHVGICFCLYYSIDDYQIISSSRTFVDGTMANCYSDKDTYQRLVVKYLYM